MRVLHFLKTSVGASWAFRQMKELVTSGVEVHVALPPGGRLIREYAKAGVVVHEVPELSSPLATIRSGKRIRSLVSEVQPDLLHSHFVATTAALRVVLGSTNRRPLVFQVPGPLHLEYWMTRVAELSLAGPDDYWLASCRWTLDRYRRAGVAENRSGLVYYGLDWRELPKQTTDLRAELGLPSDSILIGMVAHTYKPKLYLGHTRGIKGHEDFIDAIARLGRYDHRVTGIIVGGPWQSANRYYSRLVEYGRRNAADRIHFLGHREDVFGIYSALDLAVHPSHSENLGGALESMLAGVPTVATNVGGFPDLIEHGKTGWLSRSKDGEALASTVAQALQAPDRISVAQSGQDRARQLCDLKNNVWQLIHYYEKFLRHSHNRA